MSRPGMELSSSVAVTDLKECNRRARGQFPGLGDLGTEEQLSSRLADDLSMVFVNVGYTLALEYPFLIAVYDRYSASRWAVDSASD